MIFKLRKLESKTGFTLIESLISMLLLAIVLAGGIALYFNAEEIMTLAVHKKIAVEMASSRLENIKEGAYNDIVSDLAPSTITVGDFSTQQQMTVNEIGGYKEITLNTSWAETDKSSPRTFDLVTFKSP